MVYQVEPGLYFLFMTRKKEREVDQTQFVFTEGRVPKLTLSERGEKGKGRGSEVNLIGKRRNGS